MTCVATSIVQRATTDDVAMRKTKKRKLGKAPSREEVAVVVAA